MSDNKDAEIEQEPIGLQPEELKPLEDSASILSDSAVEESSEQNVATTAISSEIIIPEQDPDEDQEIDIEVEPSVEFDGDRPIVRELEYQALKGNRSSEEDEDSQADRFASVSEAKAVMEGFLFSSNEPMTVSKLSRLMLNLHPKTVRGLLLELQWDYDNRHGALQIIEIAGGYQMSTRAFVAPWMFRMHKHKRRSPLSPATLETLAIVAYRQPITKGEIETIRGVESGAPLRTLQELNLVETGGRKEVVGRPQLYVTGELFLKTFGLKSMADLPSITELKSRFMDEQKLKPVTTTALASSDSVDPEPITDSPDNAAGLNEDSTLNAESIESPEDGLTENPNHDLDEIDVPVIENEPENQEDALENDDLEDDDFNDDDDDEDAFEEEKKDEQPT